MLDKYLNHPDNNEGQILNNVHKWYGETVRKAHARYPNVPEKMIEVMISLESSGNKNATSSKGAAGLMQLMPETALSVGVSNRYDASQNIMGGTKYVSNLLNHYHDDVDLALAAYNEGPSRVDRNGLNNIPQETENYINKYHGLVDR